MVHWSPRFGAFLVNVQWIDRRATSSFVVGLTLQTAILSGGLAQLDGDPGVVMEAAIRAALMVALTVCSLGAMSAFQNEYRYQTIWLTARDLRSFLGLMLARSGAMVVVASPAVLVPLAVAFVTGEGVSLGAVGVLAVGMLVVLVAFTHVLTLVLALTYDPARVVPWVRQGTLAVLVGVVPVLSPPFLARLFPFAWLTTGAGAADPARDVGVAVGLSVLWASVATVALRRAVAATVERRLVDNVEAR